MEADVVIGLGLHRPVHRTLLAREHGIRAVVLDANQTAWGCTSRTMKQVRTFSVRSASLYE